MRFRMPDLPDPFDIFMWCFWICLCIGMIREVLR